MRGIALILGVAVALPAWAEPYIAVREGLRCSACHVNMNGGGMRTDLVSTHARDLLHYPNFFGKFSNPTDFFSGEINKYLALGGDLRASYTGTFQDLPHNGLVANDKVFRDRLETSDLDVTEAVLYGEVRLIPDYLAIYIDQRLQPSTDNREAFGLLRGVLPWNGYVKAGRMFLPYGLQLQDDGAFIRGAKGTGSANTGFSFDLQESAFELGFEPGVFTLVGAVSNGSSGDNDVRVTTTISAWLTELPVIRNLLLGNSFSRVGPPHQQSIRWGFFAGTNIERFTCLGEADFLSDRTPDTPNGRMVGRFIAYGEGDYLLFDWLNFKATIDYADDDGDLRSLADDTENRVRVGLEPFLNRFLQLRLFYSVSNGVRADPTHNQNIILAEAHLFF